LARKVEARNPAADRPAAAATTDKPDDAARYGLLDKLLSTPGETPLDLFKWDLSKDPRLAKLVTPQMIAALIEKGRDEEVAHALINEGLAHFADGRTEDARASLRAVYDRGHGAVSSQIARVILDCIDKFEFISKKPGYTGDAPSPEAAALLRLPMGETEIIQAAGALLRKVYPEKAVTKALQDLASAARVTTKRRAKAKPRLKWGKNNLPDEDPATFAWRAYQAEAKAGTLHRGLIGQEDEALAVKLGNWLRTHKMPEGIDIPTKPEWNTRQLEKLGIAASSNDDPAALATLRLYEVARKRRERTAAPD
jgi:hypothetical protein